MTATETLSVGERHQMGRGGGGRLQVQWSRPLPVMGLSGPQLSSPYKGVIGPPAPRASSSRPLRLVERLKARLGHRSLGIS